MAKYHILVTRTDVEEPHNKGWSIEFGDYSKAVVREEMFYLRDDLGKANCRIITVENDDQASIDKAFADFVAGQ